MQFHRQVSIVGTGAICLLLALPASSQDRTKRSRLIRYEVPTESGTIYVDGATLTWGKAAQTTGGTLNTGYDYAGDVQWTGRWTGARTFVTCGVKVDGNGVLCSIGFSGSPPAPTVSSQEAFVARDLVSLSWNALGQKLYLLDGVTGDILVAPWDGAATLPTAASFVVVANGYQDLHWAPGTAALQGMMPAQVRNVVSGRDSNLTGVVFSLGNGPLTRLYPGPSGTWRSEGRGYRLASASTTGPSWKLRYPRAEAPLEVFPDHAGPFDVEDVETGTVVASGTAPQAKVWQAVSLSAPLTPGRRYRLKGTAPAVPSQTFRPLVRYGDPVSDGPLVAHRGRLNAMYLYPGSSRFTPTFTLSAGTLPAGTSVSIELWVAARAPAGTDPVLVVGNLALLQAPVAIPLAITANANQDGYGVGHLLAVPDDPTLVGAVLLFQYVAQNTAGSEIVVSDVFGATVLPAPATEQSTASAPSLASVLTAEFWSGLRSPAKVAASVAEKQREILRRRRSK